MRARTVIVAAVLAVTASCSPGRTSPEVRATAPPTAAPASADDDPTVLRPGPRLPEPVLIPKDSYAPEPVVELGRVEIPAIGLDRRMFQGVTLHNIDRGPSHWTGSALPGEMGNTVVAGHRTTEDQPFRRIDELAPGDKVIFTVGSLRTTYRVTGHLVVRPADTWIADQSTAYTGTLYACHPLGSTAERYVVRLALEA